MPLPKRPTKSAKIGRPPLGKDARGEIFGVRLKPAEAKAVRDAMNAASVKPSEWMRAALLEKAGKA